MVTASLKAIPKSFISLCMGMGLLSAVLLALTVGRVCHSTYAGAGLAQAAQNGQVEGVEYWLTQGADINARDRFGDTPLMYAARNAHPRVVKTLLAHGADARLRDHFGLTATQWAMFHIRDSRLFSRPGGVEVLQVPRPEALQTLALLNRKPGLLE